MNEIAQARGGPPGKLYGSYLAEVVSVKDDKRQGRVQVRLLGFDGVGEQNAPMWARVAVPFAGADRGAFFVPSKGDEVVVQFVHGDPRLPLVIGSVWNGKARQPETLGGNGEEVDRWTFVGKRGTRIAIVEEARGPKISLTTPNATESIEIVQQEGGSIEIKTSTSTIRLDTEGVTVTSTTVKVDAVQVDVSAAMVNVDAPLAKFSGIVQANCFQAPTIVGNLYTPGAGGIW
ncbi:MAG: phage baseplate assembly protein V [Pseudomonadota bacterium]|nr:MAG: hypothetical protein DIU78_20055 [Pseudomonadota bacterium]